MQLTWFVVALNLKDKDDSNSLDNSDPYFRIIEANGNEAYLSEVIADKNDYVSWGKANFTLDNAANSVTLSFQVKDSDIGVTDPGLGKIDINLNDHPTLTSASASVGERTTCVTLGSGAKVALSNVKGDSSVASIPVDEVKKSCGLGGEDDPFCESLCAADFTGFFCSTFCSTGVKLQSSLIGVLGLIVVYALEL